VKYSGGRFLKQVGGIWVEANDDEAREKVCIAFRSFRSLRRNGKQVDLAGRDSEKETKKQPRG
jgi:hypothetical protein